jgi:alkylation response protein AidB-like acyl-CoA dehydrogenase
MSDRSVPVGGAFLVEETTPDQVFTPEELPSEARLMARSVEEYIRKEVLSLTDRIEAHEEGLMPCLVKGAGKLGLLAADVPEYYGGLGLPKSTITYLIEKAALNGSFSASIGAHTVIGTLPTLYFGTSEQKQQYLPKLAAGEIIGAFALSEANCGSDALSSQTKATLSPDGKHYLLNGTKMWTTNAGFADIFTIFAKVDGEQFTAFLVPRDTPGLTLGREEHKLGIRGSSTRRVILDNAQVPVENVLGEVGKGYRVALYVLNIGRLSLGAGSLGSSKETIKIAAQYAKQRVQFGKPIARFGLIQHKLAEMAVRCFVLESMIYRTSGYWDAHFTPIDASAPDANEKFLAASEEYAVECAILKFFGSEVLDFVVDEGLQIHGGFGFTEEFPMARAYRDARVNRIFEGTNEINRLTVLDQLMRRAQRGRLALPQAAARVKDAIFNAPPLLPDTAVEPLDEAGVWVTGIRNTTLYVAGQAWETLGEGLAEQQEIVAAIADMTATLFALESAWLRVRKSYVKEGEGRDNAIAVVRVYGNDACAQVEQWARYALAAFSAGDTLRTHLATIRRLLKPPAVDTVSARRQIAESVLSREGYPWG